MNKQAMSELAVPKVFSGIFAGWGESQIAAVRYAPNNQIYTLSDTKSAWDGVTPNASTPLEKRLYKIEADRRKTGLSLLFSAPIAGCDLLSSCLYTAGSCAAVSGKLAPVGLILVTIMLFFYRKIYSEVVTAIPNNGGCYNALLNTSTKQLAALAACLSTLSYTATAIVSGFDAMVYLEILWPQIDIRGATIVVFGTFACLTSCGLSESSFVSFGMFVLHMTMLAMLILWCLSFGISNNFEIFMENTRAPYPDIVSSSGTTLAQHNNVVAALFYGFASSLLGITGFESAANYVEEMKDNRVYVRTLDVLWLLVGVFNPLLGLVCMFVLPLEQIYAQNSSLLAAMGKVVGGTSFSNFICVDAVLVLCGAVLTSYVGITGLFRRLAQDKVLPGFLLNTNIRGANHWIIFVFFILTSSLFLAIFDPNDPTAINIFGSVYALAFLSVMFCFACACIALKVQRPFMARLVVTEWWQIYVCMACVAVGMAGNCVLTPTMLQWFFTYMSGFIVIMFLMFQTVNVLKFTIWLLKYVGTKRQSKEKKDLLKKQIKEAHDKQEEHVSDEFFQGVGSMSSDPSSRRLGSPVPGASTDPESQLSARPLSGGINGETTKAVASPLAPHPTPPPPHPANGVPTTIQLRRRVSSVAKIKGLSPNVVGWLDNGGSSFNLPKPHAHIIPSSYDFQHTQQKPVDEEEVDELGEVLQKPILGAMLRTVLMSLNAVLSEPMVFLAKSDDPLCLQEAIQYVRTNELTQHLVVVHIVDDRPLLSNYNDYLKDLGKRHLPQEEREDRATRALLRCFMATPEGTLPSEDEGLPSSFLLSRAWPAVPAQVLQLIENVSILDSFSADIRVSSLIVRGTYFSPEAVHWVCRFLDVQINSVLMGMPDLNFSYSISNFVGVRVVLKSSTREAREVVRSRIQDVLTFSNQMKKKSEVEAKKDHEEAKVARGGQTIIIPDGITVTM